MVATGTAVKRDVPDAASAPARVIVDRVSKVYSTADGSITALSDVTLHANRDEFVAIVGPTGCGKTTLLRIVAGLLLPTAGTCALNGTPITGPSRLVALVSQRPSLLPWRTVEGNLRFPIEMTGLTKEGAGQRIDSLLEATRLKEHKHAYPRELSVGMQQIVSFCVALVLDPDVLLLDEPFSSVDALSREQLGKALLDIWSRYRKAVLFVTHSIPEAVFLADRVVVLSPRPSRVVQSIDIRLPRPRSLTIVDTPAFLEYAVQIRNALKASAVTRPS